MYHARASKNNDFLFYKPEMDAAGAERIKLEADLRKAVERDELVLHYQPQIDTVSGSVVGAEALLRWKHPEYGLVPPLKFISLAEEIGLIPQLGDWVLEEACRQIKSFKDRAIKLPRVAINISALQFNSTFTKRVKMMLQQMDIPPSMLELGLAESIMTDNDDSTVEALQSLKDMGVYLSVDDFGTSYSPMYYLSSYPLDELKIDRSFVKDCDNNDGDAKLVRAIIAMADSLALNTVAEGVETEDQYRFLRRNGAKVMQGYLFSKPVTAVELETMLTPWYFAEQVQNITMQAEPEPEPDQ
jgi:EAL domain-containing protein (putative c-di-GMP-specific phosphodiesterase class I)